MMDFATECLIALESEFEWESPADLMEFSMESYIEELQFGMESDMYDPAMESATKEAFGAWKTFHSALTAKRKEMNAAKKAKNWKEAAKKARECAKIGDQMAKAINKIPADAPTSAWVRIGLTILAVVAAVGIGSAIGAKVGAINGDRLANNRMARKAAKAIGEHKFNKQAGSGIKGGLKKAGAYMNVGPMAGQTPEANASAIRGAVKANSGKAGAVVGAAATTGLAATGSQLAKFISAKKLKNGGGENLNPNDKNMLIKLVKADAASISKAYNKKAAEFDAKASAPAKESFLEADSDFLGALESYSGLSFSDPEEEPAQESDFMSTLAAFLEA